MQLKQWFFVGILLSSKLFASSFVMPEEPVKEESKPCVTHRPCCICIESTSSDHLLWQIQGAPVIPLVVDSDGTVVLGGKSVELPPHSGGRLGVGFSINQVWNGEVSAFFLHSTSTKKSVESTGLPGSEDLSSPYFNVVTDSDALYPISLSNDPNPYSGLAILRITNQMQGAELNFETNSCKLSSCEIILISGVRYLNFTEKLRFITSSPYISIPDVFVTKDKFKTSNTFLGGQFGFDVECSGSCFSVNLKSKLAFGTNSGKVAVDGALFTNDFNGLGASQGFIGGVFAQLTNIGKRYYSLFSVIPEAAVNFAYHLTSSIDLHLGYTLLYITNVLRPGKAIDQRINPSQGAAIVFICNPSLVGPAFPVPIRKPTSLWAQGLNVGFEMSF